MQITHNVALALSALSALAAAQSASPAPTATGVSPSQSSAFNQAVSSYASSFTQGAAFTALGINLRLNLPGSVFSSITQNPMDLLPIPTTSFDLESFATSPPTIFPAPSWDSYLSSQPSLQSSIGSLRTSAVVALATSAQSVLGTSVSIASPTPTPVVGSSNAAGMPARATAGPAVMAGVAGAALALAL